MLSYEMCKRLKEAGFAQDINESFYRLGCEECLGGNPERFVSKLRDELVDEKSIKIPTLSDLIEACGDVYPFILQKDRYGGCYSSGSWVAIADRDVIDDRLYDESDLECATFWCQQVDENNYKIASGNSPEEAVANLWLKLNKK